MSRTDQRFDVYETVTNRIIEEMEKGTVPWQQSWGNRVIPQNLVTRKPYRGINLMLLNMLSYEENYFLTFKQLKVMGGSVKKGEKSHLIVYWNVREQENEQHEKVKTYLLRYYLVFNIAQCEKIPEGLLPQRTEWENDPIAACEEILKVMPDTPNIVHKGKNPYYHRIEDYISMPKLKSFRDSESYYSVLFHELVHSSGHTSRLNRKSLMESESFGTDLYSMEELIAELGSCYLRSHAGIMQEVSNSAAYIENWLVQFKSDKRFIFHASSQAQKAVDYILDLNPKVEETVEESEEAMLE